jgi:hypothetical protein
MPGAHSRGRSAERAEDPDDVAQAAGSALGAQAGWAAGLGREGIVASGGSRCAQPGKLTICLKVRRGTHRYTPLPRPSPKHEQGEGSPVPMGVFRPPKRILSIGLARPPFGGSASAGGGALAFGASHP